MKTTPTQDTFVAGMDTAKRGLPSRASLIRNMRFDEEFAWTNDRGWEPLIPGETLETYSPTDLAALLSPCRFLSIWSRHQSAETYYLQERAGELFYEFGNIGLSSSRKVTLSEGRNLPRPNDPGTQIAPFGRFALVLNGFDEPFKFWGRTKTTPFGWVNETPAPQVAGVREDPASLGDNLRTDVAVRFGNVYRGLGTPSSSPKRDRYGYKISFVSDTGSESPLSATTYVSWKLASLSPAERAGVLISHLPTGPNHVVARRIYRTKNLEDGIAGNGEVYYLVKQIDDNTTENWIDSVPDTALVTAKDLTESRSIDTGYKYAVAWNNRMFLAGGESHPTNLIYSQQGLPEQFGVFNFFDVGSRTGGHITALVPYYNSLLVFRERSIDVVTANSDGVLRIGELTPDIGTTATNTIVSVPGVGLVFLTHDGFYRVTGGLQGGAVHKVEPISGTIKKEMRRLSISALARATATYSPKEEEYWCHYPVDSQTECSRGAAFSTRSKGWSLRNTMNFTQLATDPSGWVIIGTDPHYDPATPADSTGVPGYGLQVWSAAPWQGNYFTFNSTVQGGIRFNVLQSPKEESLFVSTWKEFGARKDSVKSVEVVAITTGDNDLTLEWGKDGDVLWTSAGTIQPQVQEVANTTSAEPTYSPAVTRTTAEWDTSRFSEARLTRYRWDVDPTSAYSFRFRLSSANLFRVVSFNYEVAKTQTKARSR